MQPKWCVIFNPNAGRGQARRRLERMRRQLGERAEFRPTTRSGHAEELAHQAALDGFAGVAAAGGDGTVHEVANGLLRAGRPEVELGLLPIGSANDYAISLGFAGETPPAEPVRVVDVGVVGDGTGRERHFVCCLGLGLNGMVTLEARRIKRLQGLALYGLAALRALWYHHACPRLTIQFDDQPPQQWPTLMMSLMIARQEGSFVMAPDALLDDGLFDYVHAGDISRWRAFGLVPYLALFGPPRHNPRVKLGHCARVRLQSPTPLTVHIDGEFFATPDHAVTTLEVRLLPRALRVRAWQAM
jgi:diacylglycerol kinase family enzyme